MNTNKHQFKNKYLCPLAFICGQFLVHFTLAQWGYMKSSVREIKIELPEEERTFIE